MQRLSSVRRRIFCHLDAADELRDELRPILHDAGIDLVTAADPADAVIIDLRAPFRAASDIAAAIKTARRQSYRQPAIFLVDPEQYSAPSVQALLARDRVVPFSRTFAPLIATLRQAAAAKMAADELSVRSASSTSLGLPLPLPEIEPQPAITLLQCTPSPHALEVLGELSVRLALNASIRNGQSLTALESGRADALILLADKNRRQQSGLIRMLRRHSDLSDVPVLVLERAPSPRHLAYWTATGADNVFASSQIMAAVNAIDHLRNRRRASQSLSRQLRLASVNDRGAASRLAGSRFFEACVFERMHRQTGPFSLGALQLEAKDGTSAHPDALAEVAIYLSMALPEADLACRIGQDAFLISFSGCDHRSALKAMDNVAGMIGDLQFGPRDAAISFSPKTNTVCSTDYRTAASLLRSAVVGLRPSSKKTAAAQSI